jgi:putative transposase
LPPLLFVVRKWSNLNLPGALHFITGNVLDRTRIFTDPTLCVAFLGELRSLNQTWPSKLIAYVLMPDHFHLISNPRDGRIREFIGSLKSLSARRMLRTPNQFLSVADGHHVWQQSFKAMPLWSSWMIWQKINYIHANPVKAGLVGSAEEYPWSSFRSFYSRGDSAIVVDRNWSWDDDAEKLSRATKQMSRRI